MVRLRNQSVQTRLAQTKSKVRNVKLICEIMKGEQYKWQNMVDFRAEVSRVI